VPQGEVGIDERLEKLVERHAALTLTVELMVAENRKRDRRGTDILEAVARLAHIAEIHVRRFERLEEQQ
jgi:hypothetical protein